MIPQNYKKKEKENINIASINRQLVRSVQIERDFPFDGVLHHIARIYQSAKVGGGRGLQDLLLDLVMNCAKRDRDLLADIEINWGFRVHFNHGQDHHDPRNDAFRRVFQGVPESAKHRLGTVEKFLPESKMLYHRFYIVFDYGSPVSTQVPRVKRCQMLQVALKFLVIELVGVNKSMGGHADALRFKKHEQRCGR